MDHFSDALTAEQVADLEWAVYAATRDALGKHLKRWEATDDESAWMELEISLEAFAVFTPNMCHQERIQFARTWNAMS